MEAIVKKPLGSAPKRLQGKAQKFDTTLSRAYLPNNAQGEFETISALAFLSISKERREQIFQSTNKDEVLQLLKEIILKGWPNDN